MGLMMCDGKFVSRNEVALVPTPGGTESWKPVPHMEVIEAVTDVVNAHQWQILDENFGLAREGQKMFGVCGSTKVTVLIGAVVLVCVIAMTKVSLLDCRQVSA